VWRVVQSEPVTINVKHEGPLPALRLRGMKGETKR
jgi:hypothetical protein